MRFETLPNFKQLPLNPSDPPFSAWIHGKNDSLGTLNYLTADIVKSASLSIKTGQRLCLNWSNAHPKFPGFGRKGLTHTVIRKGDRIVCDDEIHFNTQHSSQWDGLRHFGYQEEAVFYNDLKLEHILNSTDAAGDRGNKGMHEWAEQGIAGRGHLIDVFGWAEQNGTLYDPFTTFGVSFEDFKACYESQGLQESDFKAGDFLLIRTGYHAKYSSLNDHEREQATKANPPSFAGMAQSKAFAEWVYNHRIAAVAGDAPAFEAWPASRSEDPALHGKILHEIFLAGWGMPIGEMFYLEDLVNMCRSEKRWTCFLSSSPLNIEGGIASPPNIMAIM